jgi:hypothetical protein
MSPDGSIGGRSMLRFDDVLELTNDGTVALDATGPLDRSNEEMVEICAWVFQRGDEDAAATEMTTGKDHATAGGSHLHVFTDADGRDRWKLSLRQVGDTPLKAGDAFGVAVAMLKSHQEGDKQRVIWWGHPITLV